MPVVEENKKGIIKFFFKLLLMAILLLPLMFFLDKKYTTVISVLKDDKIHFVSAMKKREFDIAYIGSSRVYNIVDVLEIDSALGISGVNLGMEGAAYAENFILFSNFLKNKNSIRTLCIQADMWGLIPAKDAYSHPFSEEKYIYLLGDKTVDSVYLSNSNNLKFYFRKLIPFFRYSEFETQYPLDLILTKKNRESTSYKFEPEKGSMLLDGRKKGIVFSDYDLKKINTSFFPKSINSLRNIIRLAKRNNINVVLFTSPSYFDFISRQPLEKSSKDTINKIAREFGLSYFDFEKLSLCKDSTLFRDYTHLNKRGARLFSSSFSDSLKTVLHE